MLSRCTRRVGRGFQNGQPLDARDFIAVEPERAYLVLQSREKGFIKCLGE